MSWTQAQSTASVVMKRFHVLISLSINNCGCVIIQSRYIWMTCSLLPCVPIENGLPHLLGRPIYTSYFSFLQWTVFISFPFRVDVFGTSFQKSWDSCSCQWAGAAWPCNKTVSSFCGAASVARTGIHQNGRLRAVIDMNTAMILFVVPKINGVWSFDHVPPHIPRTFLNMALQRATRASCHYEAVFRPMGQRVAMVRLPRDREIKTWNLFITTEAVLCAGVHLMDGSTALQLWYN